MYMYRDLRWLAEEAPMASSSHGRRPSLTNKLLLIINNHNTYIYIYIYIYMYIVTIIITHILIQINEY